MKKRLLPFLLAFALCISLFPSAALASGDVCYIRYADVDTLEVHDDLIKLTPLTDLFDDMEEKDFVFELPGGGTQTLRLDAWASSFDYAISSFKPLTIGTYKLKSFPVPQGYTVVDILFEKDEFFDKLREKVIQYYGEEKLPLLLSGQENIRTFILSGHDSYTLNEEDVKTQFFVSFMYVIVKKTANTTIAKPMATPTASFVRVNSQNIVFDAYNINGNNYFKLRDLAYVLRDSAKKFEVSWDSETDTIYLTSGRVYTPVGGELSAKGRTDKPITPTQSKIQLDGQDVNFECYNINGNNYFKLRDIGAAFDFGVEWDEPSNLITINTRESYSLK